LTSYAELLVFNEEMRFKSDRCLKFRDFSRRSTVYIESMKVKYDVGF